jgi:hypothetical protein
MTRRLKEAFRAASALPAEEQDALAEVILAEVAGDAEWDERFRQSGQTLERLADEALDEFRRGKTRPLDPKRI